MIGPVVPLAWEVDPFWVTELVSHEIEVAAVDGCCRHQADHLVQGDATVHGIGAAHQLRHEPVHIGIDQAEDDGLVSHQCLVVTLGIGDGLLIGTPVGGLPPDGRGVPLLIFLLLDQLDPEVGDVHRQAVVEAITPCLGRHRQSRHTAHLLGDGDCLRIDLVDQLVGQREVTDGVAILSRVVVVAIVAERFSQSVAAVDHRGDPVETEAVEAELIEPVFAVGEKEVKHLILAVIKAQRIPCLMVSSLRAAVEIEVIRSIHASQALYLILHCV